ncbi:MAG: hypothetical protein PVI57_00300 [Gemmatimonadota bacterium]|jgi:hypothetical protein
MDDDAIIDLGEYLRRKEEAAPGRTMFAIWGGEGERTRFALPLWRAACLAGGARASLAFESPGDAGDELRPFVVLDLGAEPARTVIASARVASLRGEVAPPALGRSDGGLAVYLGGRDGRRWYLVVDDLDGSAGGGDEGVEDLYFLAGECAGLLFHRELDAEAGGG